MKLNWFLTGLLCATLAIGSVAAPLPAGLGTVGGQVLDLKGKLVANAHVTLQASDGGQLQTTQTNTQGRFWFPFLPEGQYSVRASDQGRVSEWRQNVWVSPGHQTDVILHLRRQNRVVR
jgi:carboxypeptidase family protein